MTTWEIVGSCIVSALAGSSVLAAIVKFRGQRTLATDAWVRQRVDKLEKRIDEKDAECDRQLAEIRAELADQRERGEECERRSDRLQTQLNRLRSWMRTDPSEREDLTPVETPAKKRGGP